MEVPPYDLPAYPAYRQAGVGGRFAIYGRSKYWEKTHLKIIPLIDRDRSSKDLLNLIEHHL